MQQFAAVAAAGQGDVAAVLGASFSTGGGRASKSEERELAQAGDARGLKCILPGGRRRETLQAEAVAGADADFMWRVVHSLPVTGSSHSVSPVAVMAKWLNSLSCAAPCQWRIPGRTCTQSPI